MVNSPFPWAAAVMFLGALQGLLLFAALWHRGRGKSPANRLLGALMLLTAVRLFHVGSIRVGWAGGRWDWSLPLILTFSPLLYLYCRSLLEAEFRFKTGQWAHFLPAALWAFGRVLGFVFFSAPGAAGAGQASWLGSYFPDLVWLAQTLIYLALILGLLRRHRREAPRVLSAVDGVRLSWIRRLAGAFAFLCGLIVVFLLGRAFGLRFIRPSNAVLYVSVAVIVYLWGYFGLRQPEVFVFPPETKGPAPSAPSLADAPSPRAPEYLERLRRFMEERSPHLDPELTLYDLARAIEIPPYQLTALLNGSLGQTFFEFVNARRVEEAKKKLSDPAFDNRKILALALDSGFASKSAFNRVFKEMTGETPSSYRKRRTGPSAGK